MLGFALLFINMVECFNNKTCLFFSSKISKLKKQPAKPGRYVGFVAVMLIPKGRVWFPPAAILQLALL